jgi:iron complex outermembrane receptor protein
MPVTRILAAVAMMWIAPAIWSAEGGAAEEPLVEKVEVRADAPDAEDVAAFATRLQGSDLTGRGADLGDLLRRVPGARVRSYGGLGRFATVSFRASTAEQVTVLLDGIPQNRALGGPVDLASIPATQIAEVTVFRGFGPASAGLGGMGGLVDIRTKAPDGEPEAKVDLLAGEMDSVRLSAGWSLAAGEDGGLRIGAEWIDSQGDFDYLDTGATPFNSYDDEVRSRENNDLRHGSLLVQGTWDRVGGGRLHFNLRGQDREQGVPGIDAFPAEEARLDESIVDGRLAWSWRRDDGFARGLDLAADGFRESQHLKNPEAELGRIVKDQTTRVDGGGISGLFRASAGRHRLLARLDARREEANVKDRALDVEDRGGAERDVLAATVEDVIPIGRVVLAPAIRWEHRRDDFVPGGGGAPPPRADDVSDGLWSGKLGVAVRLGGGCTARGSGGTFFRVPNLLELFGDRGSVVGNPDLVPEEGKSLETGVACARESAPVPWAFEVVGFGRDSDDLILFVPNSQGTAVARNIGAARIRGAEASVALGWGDAWSLDASGTLQRARDDTGGYTDGNPLVGIPERTGYLGLGWRHGRLAARWEVTYVGENSTTAVDDPDFYLSSRTLHDVSLRYRWTQGITVGLDARNVFDRMTRDVARFPLPGRAVFVHVGWRHGGAG